MAENNSKGNRQPKLIPSQTPTSNTDFVNIAQSHDGSVLMQFISFTPDYAHENHRTVMSLEEVKELIDDLCDITKYYPAKPRKKRVIKRRKPSDK